MPLSATEILPTSGTGSYFSPVGTGADDGLTLQPAAWPAAAALELGAGLPPGVLVEHAATARRVAVAIKARFASRWRYTVLVMLVPLLLLARVGLCTDDAAAVDRRPE